MRWRKAGSKRCGKASRKMQRMGPIIHPTRARPRPTKAVAVTANLNCQSCTTPLFMRFQLLTHMRNPAATSRHFSVRLLPCASIQQLRCCTLCRASVSSSTHCLSLRRVRVFRAVRALCHCKQQQEAVRETQSKARTRREHYGAPLSLVQSSGVP